MLCTICIDIIASKVQCGECLCDTKRMTDSTEGTDVTLFCCRAFARYCAPCGSISLELRWSVVSVYAKEKQ